MQYIISSRGRPIGTTELDFVRINGSSRSGWFHPNALGDEVMPTVALVYPAMRAFVCRNLRDDDGQPIVQEGLRHSTLFADLAEALHHVDALDLTLHCSDGTLIPTSLIGLQDTEQLRALAKWDDLYPDRNPSIGEDEPDHDFRRDLAFDLELDLDELPESCWEELEDEFIDLEYEGGWDPDELSELPRYQVHLVLSEENSIP